MTEGEQDERARARLDAFRERLASVRVLDPACGSGNFLYIALRSLLDFEREVIDFAAVQGWQGLTPTGAAGPDAGAWRSTTTRRNWRGRRCGSGTSSGI